MKCLFSGMLVLLSCLSFAEPLPPKYTDGFSPWEAMPQQAKHQRQQILSKQRTLFMNGQPVCRQYQEIYLKDATQLTRHWDTGCKQYPALMLLDKLKAKQMVHSEL